MRAAAVITALLLTAAVTAAQDSLPRPPVFDSTRAVRVNPPIVAVGSIPGIAGIVNREYTGDNGRFYFFAHHLFQWIADIREPVAQVTCWHLTGNPTLQPAGGKDPYVMKERDQFTFLPGKDSIHIILSRQHSDNPDPGVDTTLPTAMLENYRIRRREHPAFPENTVLNNDTLFYFRDRQLSNRLVFLPDGRLDTDWSFSDGDTLITRYTYKESGLPGRLERSGANGAPFQILHYHYNALNMITQIEQEIPNSGSLITIEQFAYRYFVTPNHHFVIEKSAQDHRHAKPVPIERYTFDERFHWIAVENFAQHYVILRRLEYP